jgi:hypothetical protein
MYIYYYLTITVLLLWGDLSDERTGLTFVNAAGPCQRSQSRVRVPWDSRQYFTLRFETSLFIASYDWQGHGGGIRPPSNSSRCIPSGRTYRKHRFHCYPPNTSIVACLFVAAGKCLPRRCLVLNVYSDFTILVFGRHVTISYIQDKMWTRHLSNMKECYPLYTDIWSNDCNLYYYLQL